VDARHTVAIRSVTDAEGRITMDAEGCGGVGVNRGEVIPYVEGKRCWVNEHIYGVRGPAAWERQPHERRPVLGAGDADTDVTFVGDATGLRVVLDRHRPEIMCRALDGRQVAGPADVPRTAARAGRPLPVLHDGVRPPRRNRSAGTAGRRHGRPRPAAAAAGGPGVAPGAGGSGSGAHGPGCCGHRPPRGRSCPRPGRSAPCG
jgi:hypothetical protein